MNQLPVPSLHSVLVIPDVVLQTKDARSLLKDSISLEQYDIQSSLLSQFIVSCFTNDLKQMRQSLEDIIIEPQRAHLIPNFIDFKEIAQRRKSIGFGISGAGPTMFTLIEDLEEAEILKERFQKVQSDDTSFRVIVSEISDKGATILPEVI